MGYGIRPVDVAKSEGSVGVADVRRTIHGSEVLLTPHSIIIHLSWTDGWAKTVAMMAWWAHNMIISIPVV